MYADRVVIHILLRKWVLKDFQEDVKRNFIQLAKEASILSEIYAHPQWRKWFPYPRNLGHDFTTLKKYPKRRIWEFR